LATPEKIEAVAEFKQRVENSQIAIATKYIGINAAQITDLRGRLRNGNVYFKVFKNTLVRRALDEMMGRRHGPFAKTPFLPPRSSRNSARMCPWS